MTPQGGGGVNIPKDVLFEDVFTNRGNLLDCNDATMKSGIYGVNQDQYVSNAPIEYGMMVVFNGEGTAQGGNPFVRIAFGYDGVIKVAIRWQDGGTDWRTI